MEVGIGDDCAVIRLSDDLKLLVTTDLLVENVHFLRNATYPEMLGRKSLAVNLSDIAAMGGTPHSFYISVAIPENLEEDFLDRFRDGMAEIASEYEVDLLGGDTTASPEHLFINITLLGWAQKGKYLPRNGAKPGDIIQVSGPLGNSAGGLYTRLNQINSTVYEPLRNAHDNPAPRIEAGKALAEINAVSSMIDISDGIAQDLGHICSESRVGAVVNIERIPVDDLLSRLAVESNISVYPWVLAGGEDYELCWTVHPDSSDEALDAAARAGAPSPRSIGRIVEHGEVQFCLNGRRYDLPQKGWDHFRRTGRNDREGN